MSNRIYRVAIILAVVVFGIFFFQIMRFLGQTNLEVREHLAMLQLQNCSREIEIIGEFQTPAISKGEKATGVYTIEIWDDGSVKVITTQGYLHQLNEDTVLITDQSYAEVMKELSYVE